MTQSKPTFEFQLTANLAPMQESTGLQINGSPANELMEGSGGDDTMRGRGGDDTLFGMSGNDTLRGGSGRNVMDGGRGDDTYITDSPDDLISEGDYGFSGGGIDTVITSYSGYQLGYEIENLTLIGNTAVVGYGNGQDNRLTGNSAANRLYGDWGDDTLLGNSGDDTLDGSVGNDSLLGGSGDDLLEGGSGDDTLYGGGGKDRLETWDGNNTILFRQGQGADTLSSSYGSDTVLVADGLQPDQFSVRMDWATGDLVLRRMGSGDSLHLERFAQRSGAGIHGIQFADGTFWSRQDLLPLIYTGDAGANSITGSDGHDTLTGQAGNDTLADGSYNDQGNDLLLGGAGDDVLSAHAGSDTLDGGAGNDFLQASGDWNADTFIFGRGYGQDTLQADNYAGLDILKLGVSTRGVSLSMDEGDLLVSLTNSTDTLRIQNFMYSDSFKVSRFVFSDGTTWNQTAIIRALNPADNGDNNLFGSSGFDVIDGLGGNDTITGNDFYGNDRGSDRLLGGQGDDELDGGVAGNDTLDGGTGNDYLIDMVDWEHTSADTFVFGKGYGHDTLQHFDFEGSASTDRLRLGANPDEVSLSLDGSDVVLRIDTTGDTLRLKDFTYGSNYWVNRFEFADGTVWNEAAILAHFNTVDEQGNYLFGTAGDDTLAGLGGNDTLHGDDVFGNDSGSDSLSGGEGNDVLLSGAGGADTLDGGVGDDVLSAFEGGELGSDDVFIFGQGYGQDTIYNYDPAGGYDVLEMLAGVSAEDVGISRDGDDLLLTLLGTGDSVRLARFTDDTMQLDAVQFTDGTTWDTAYLLAQPIYGDEGDNTLSGTANSEHLVGLGGNDELYSFGGNDTLDGGSGDDWLQSAGWAPGSNTFIFGQGYGHDTISNYDYAPDAVRDVVVIKEGVSAQDISVLREGADLVLSINSTGDSLRLGNFFYTEYQIEAVEFADGTVWNAADLLAQTSPAGLMAAEAALLATLGSTAGTSTGDDLFTV